MTILHIHDRVGRYGGGEVYLAQLREGLRQRGHHTPVLYLTQEGTETNLGSDEHCARKPHGLLSGMRMKQWLGPLLDRIKPDAVHCHTLFSPFGMAWLCRRVPMVFTLHSLHMLPRKAWREPMTVIGLYDRLLRQLMRPALKGLALWIAPSEAFAREIRNEGYRNVAVIPHFTGKRPTQAIGRVGSRTILFVGRLSAEKGIEEFIESLTYLLDQPWHAVIVGDGPLQNRVRNLIQKQGIASRVRLTGWLSGTDLDQQYRDAQVVVVPSVVMEAFSLVGIEAMAFGKPVVAFDAGGVREWLRDGRTGYLVEQGNCRGLAERIRALIENPSRAKMMGEEGKQVVEECFRIDSHLERVTQVYEEVIHRCRNGALSMGAYAYRN